MIFIKTIPENEAPADVKRIYENVKQSRGYIPNYAKAFSLRPAVMDAWINLIKSIQQNMDMRIYELVTLAAARTLRSSYCMLAHGKVLKDKYYSDGEIIAFSLNPGASALPEKEKVMMQFAEKIVINATSITKQDVDHLREHGLSDEEIFDITVTTTARCFFSKTLDALGVEADSIYHGLADNLKNSLVVGRPINQEI